MIDITEKLFSFIKNSPTAFNSVCSIKKELVKNGYSQLKEEKEFNIEYGKKYFVVRNSSSLIAFSVPKKSVKGFHIVASHTDSPSFKLKTCPEIGTDAYVKLNVEKYGGMIMSTWFDRPLSIAGRVFVNEGEKISERLVNIDRDLLVIPNLAIHLNRKFNSGYEYNPQIDLLPIFSEDKEGKIYNLISKELNIDEDSILSSELFLYVRDSGRRIGDKNQWILAPRLDDLQCVFTSLYGLIDATPEKYISMAVFFDNEEVGSGTKQGADSTFLEDIIERICMSLNISREEKYQMLADSFMVSADNAHGVHPNHPEKSDPTNHPRLNGGIVIKYHGGQKYTTDGYSAAYFENICRECNAVTQTYCNRSDEPGGSTLGNISQAHISIPTVDVGFSELAMHSAVETAGARDTEDGINIFRNYFSK